ncbi:MAG: hypothetical protein DDT34_02501 [Firmicutes bacterium]|nr:hypothetical protein [Bacillota bacterium]
MTGIVVKHIDVQFTLLCETGEGQIAAAEIAGGWIGGVRTKEEIELCVQRMGEKQLDNDFLICDLGG